jgi:diguanylate cyclase (GGDEF)-like protein
MMSWPYAINSLAGSYLIIILIFADYFRKYNTDTFQRALFFKIIFFALTAISADLVFFSFQGQPGVLIHRLLWAGLGVFYVFRTLAYFFIFIFLDYLALKDAVRTTKITRFLWGLTLLHILTLGLNCFLGFYYYITPENSFIPGKLPGLRLFFGLCPALLAVLNLWFSRKKIRTAQFYLIIFFLIINGIGVILEAVLDKESIIWTCFSSGLLYGYFFIIRIDSRIDSLTGIGNRYSFNEFIDKISKSNTKKPYSIVMIDVDQFKRINDTLGHLEGDNALRDLAAIIKSSVRRTDFAARYGGDEFVLAAPTEEGVKKLLERVQQGIANHNEKKIRPYEIHISYGYDTYVPGGPRSIEEFLNHIDNLMYKNKAARHRSGDFRSALTAGDPPLGAAKSFSF